MPIIILDLSDLCSIALVKLIIFFYLIKRKPNFTTICSGREFPNDREFGREMSSSGDISSMKLKSVCIFVIQNLHFSFAFGWIAFFRTWRSIWLIIISLWKQIPVSDQNVYSVFFSMIYTRRKKKENEWWFSRPELLLNAQFDCRKFVGRNEMNPSNLLWWITGNFCSCGISNLPAVKWSLNENDGKGRHICTSS